MCDLKTLTTPRGLDPKYRLFIGVVWTFIWVYLLYHALSGYHPEQIHEALCDICMEDGICVIQGISPRGEFYAYEFNAICTPNTQQKCYFFDDSIYPSLETIPNPAFFIFSWIVGLWAPIGTAFIAIRDLRRVSEDDVPHEKYS